MNKPCEDLSNLPPEIWDEDEANIESVTPGQLKVVVVDDDELMRRLLRRALTGLGFTQIHIAEHGKAGLALAERERPAIIISDYHMPGMHGLKLVEAIRGNEALDQTIVIMLSAADDQVVIE